MRLRAFIPRDGIIVDVERLDWNKDGSMTFWFQHPANGSARNSVDEKNGILLRDTGLKDKKWKDIFEGDLIKKQCFDGVRSYEYIGVVVYDHDGFCLKSLKVSATTREEYDQENLKNTKVHEVGTLLAFGRIDDKSGNLEKEEVIGNIYENKPLV
jgi:uncharacterized phage protein (TIGR01671 family)